MSPRRLRKRTDVDPAAPGEADELEQLAGVDPLAAARAIQQVHGPGERVDGRAVVALQQSAGNRVVSNSVTIQARRERRPDQNVGAVSSGVVLDHRAPGQAGYSSRAMAEAGEMAEAMRTEGSLDELMVRQVAPDVSGVAAQERVVSRAQQLWLDQKSRFATSSTNEIYQGWGDSCQRWLDDVAAHQRELQQYATGFNAFAPRANSLVVSAARLSSLQALLGATDNESLAAALQSGLSDATRVAERYRDAMEGSDAHGPETLDVPVADDSVESSSADVTVATRDLNTAYVGFRRAMTGGEIDKVNEEGAADRIRLAKINQAKQFVRQVGSLIDTTMSVVSGAPAAVTNVTNTMRRAEAQVNAVRNRRAILRGERPRHNPTYVTTDKEGNLLIANAQTAKQRRADGVGEAADIPTAGITLPTSVENILGTVTDFIYAGEVRDINMRLQAIASRVTAIQNWERGAAIAQATAEFQNKLNEFAVRCNQLQGRIAARRNAYLQFGLQLDRFARSDRAARGEGLGTGANQERYATILTAAGQVREVLVLARTATGGFGNAREFGRWAVRVRERRQESSAFSHRAAPMSSGPYWTVPSYDLTPGELTAIEAIFSQVSRFENMRQMIERTFGGVDTAATTLFTNPRVSPGGGSGAY